jgi:hypothetical protein
VISDRFTYLTYRWHWHYTVLRGLDYLRLTPAIDDARLDDAIALLRQRRKPNGALAAAEADSRHAARRSGEAGVESRWTRSVLFASCAAATASPRRPAAC